MFSRHVNFNIINNLKYFFYNYKLTTYIFILKKVRSTHGFKLKNMRLSYVFFVIIFFLFKNVSPLTVFITVGTIHLNKFKSTLPT